MGKKIIGEDGKTYAEKKPIYKKWWFILLVVIVVMSAISNIGKNGTSETKKETTQTAENKTEAAKKEIIYEKITAKQLINDLEGNALKATETYKGKDYEITGVLGNIDAQGAYITIDPSVDSFVLTGVQAYIQNDDQKKIVTELSKGDKIVVKGKIKDVGEVLGYSVDIAEISKASSK